MTDYEKLKEVIQQANPEIMELKFGCEVKVKIGTFISKFGKNHNIINFNVTCKTNGGYFVTSSYDASRHISEDSIVKILGRPIRLADVLLATIDTVMLIGALSGDTITFAVFGKVAFWNLKDDNLDHQSAETKQFLIDLLVIK
jgi:hypothetical protein